MSEPATKLRWICLVHGVIGCRCGSRDVAPFGDGAFHRWCRPRAGDVYLQPQRPGGKSRPAPVGPPPEDE